MGYERISCGVAHRPGKEDRLTLQGWLVEGRLDSKHLQKAWWDIIKDWPLLAARLRVNPAKKDQEGRGKWEYEVPDEGQVKLNEACDHKKQEDDPTRTFSIISRLNEPVRKVYPFKTSKEMPTNQITVLEPRNVAKDLDIWMKNRPSSFERLLIEDRPIICVQVCCFQDATMICFAAPAFLDHPLDEIASTWIKYINGDGSLPKLDTEDTEESIPLIEAEPKPAPPGWHVFSQKEISAIGERVIWENFINFFKSKKSINKERRTIHIPEGICNDIHQQAIRDVDGDEKKTNKIELDDALAAWMIKKCHADKTKDGRLLDISLVLPKDKVKDMSIEQDLLPFARRFFRQQSSIIILPSAPASHFISQLSLGQLAALIHDEVGRRMTPECLNQQALWMLWAFNKKPVPCGATSNSFILGMSGEKRRRRILEMDFSTDKSNSAKVLQVWSDQGAFNSPLSIFRLAGISGSDATGSGVYAWASLSQKKWAENFK